MHRKRSFYLDDVLSATSAAFQALFRSCRTIMHFRNLEYQYLIVKIFIDLRCFHIERVIVSRMARIDSLDKNDFIILELYVKLLI